MDKAIIQEEIGELEAKVFDLLSCNKSQGESFYLLGILDVLESRKFNLEPVEEARIKPALKGKDEEDYVLFKSLYSSGIRDCERYLDNTGLTSLLFRELFIK